MPNYNHPSLSDPNVWATQQALQDYPWLRRLNAPIDLTIGKGPYMDESYTPRSEENPYPGHFTVQLRDPGLVNHPAMWPSALGREGIDFAARTDPTYQSAAEKFRSEMTPEQFRRSQGVYTQATTVEGEMRPFDRFMKDAQLQEYIGGYLLGMPGWKNRSQYSPIQLNLLDRLSQYMYQGQKPVPFVGR